MQFRAHPGSAAQIRFALKLLVGIGWRVSGEPVLADGLLEVRQRFFVAFQLFPRLPALVIERGESIALRDGPPRIVAQQLLLETESLPKVLGRILPVPRLVLGVPELSVGGNKFKSCVGEMIPVNL